MRPSPSRARPRLARRMAWLVVTGLAAAALLDPGLRSAVAAEPSATPGPTPTPLVTAEPTPVATPEPTPVVTPQPTPEPTPEPTPSGASILIAKIDNNGTADPSDDVFLDGARFAAYLDDGDAVFERDVDQLVYGPEPTVDSLLDTDVLPPGEYWIVETVVPSGFVGTDAILVELNTDPTITCIWDLRGLFECVPNDGDVEGLSWTIVIVDNTPLGVAPSQTGGVGGATGTPAIPDPTLPPTDTVSARSSRVARDGWPLILIAMAGVLATALVRTPVRPPIRRDDPEG